MGLTQVKRPRVVEVLDRSLSLSDVTAGYGSQPIVFGVSLEFAVGTLSAIIGPNGAGKSTLLKSIFGLARLFSGSVELDGVSSHANGRALVKAGIAYVPQRQNVFPSLTVLENFEIGGVSPSGVSCGHIFYVFPAPTSVRALPARR